MTIFKTHNQFLIFFLWTIMVIVISGCSHKSKTPDPGTILKPGTHEKVGFKTDTPEKNHIALAKQLIEKKYYDVALRQLKTAPGDRSNRSAELYYLMGVCYRESERFTLAVEYFNRAIEINRVFSFAFNGLGLTHALTGQNEKALEYFLKAIELNPARADFHNNAGFLEMRQGQFKKAIKFLRKAISIDSGFKQAINNLAICLGMTGKEEEALALLLKTGSQETAWHNMGVIYHMQGKDKEAEEMFKKAKER